MRENKKQKHKLSHVHAVFIFANVLYRRIMCVFEHKLFRFLILLLQMFASLWWSEWARAWESYSTKKAERAVKVGWKRKEWKKFFISMLAHIFLWIQLLCYVCYTFMCFCMWVSKEKNSINVRRRKNCCLNKKNVVLLN
jgi:hypothetical protein